MLNLEEKKEIILRNLIALGLTYFIILLPINALGAYLQIFAYELGASPEIIGILLAIPFIFSMIARFIGGYLADALGRKPVIVYTYLLGIAAYFIFITATYWVYLIPFQILSGLIFLSQAAEASLMSESLPSEKRSTGMTLAQLPSALGLIFGPILASIVYARTKDVITTCKIFGEFLIFGYFLSFLIRLILVKETKLLKEKPSIATFFSEYRYIFSNIFSTLKAPLYVDVAIFMMFGFVMFTQLFAIKYLGVDPEIWGYLLAMLSVFVIVGGIPGMIIGDKKGRVLSFKIATLLASFGFPFIAFAKELAYNFGELNLGLLKLNPIEAVLFLAGIVVAISYGMAYAVAGAYITELFPSEMRGKGVTIFLFFGDIGLILGFVLSGFIYQNIDPRAVYIIASIIMLTSFVMCFKLPETLKKKE